MTKYGILKDASFWGPGLWKYLHCLSLTTESNFEELSEFITLLIKFLPCDACRIHSQNFMKDWATDHTPFLINSTEEFSRFINELHNHASHYAGKNIPYISLEESKEMMLRSYRDFHIQDIVKNDWAFWCIIAITGLFIFCILYSISSSWTNYKK